MAGNDANCDVKCHDEKNVGRVRKNMLEEETFTNLAETFKTLGDNTRIKILYALRYSELCVHDISAVLEMSVSAVSHQLRILRNMKLVKYRKEGKSVIYSLSDDHVIELIRTGFEHVVE